MLRGRVDHSRALRRFLRWLLRAALLVALLFGGVSIAAMALLRVFNPPTTMVQIERRVEAWHAQRAYHKRYTFVPLAGISKDLQHAVIAAEDARFFQHNGIDWVELRKVVEDDLENGRLGRGGSTISQQLIKNLFLSTRRSLVRKGLEFALVPLAERILSKKRILELYLNVIEWGPGIYGAEEAAKFYYKTPASRVGREQASRLAAVIPAPLTRRPARMNEYSAEILTRMRNVGW
jgi:monofunctional glycosyltransferase